MKWNKYLIVNPSRHNSTKIYVFIWLGCCAVSVLSGPTEIGLKMFGNGTL